MSPNQLFLLFVAGVLAMYSGTVFAPARILALLGAGCAITGIYFAATYPIRPAGLAFLATAVALLGLEFFSKMNFVAGVAGAVLLPYGFVLLYSGPQRISKWLAIPLGLTLGLATAALCWSAKRARMNKWTDL